MATQLDTVIHMMLRAQWQASNEMLNGLLHEARKVGDKDAIRRIAGWKRINNQCRVAIDRNIPAEAVSAFPPYIPNPEDLVKRRQLRRKAE